MLQVQVVLPRGAEHSCTKGEGRMIDFVLASHSAQHFIADVFFDREGPWTTHFGIVVEFHAGADHASIVQLKQPTAFDHPVKEQQKPTSKKGVERRQQRFHGQAEAKYVFQA